MSTTMDLRESIAALHRTPGLVHDISTRRQHEELRRTAGTLHHRPPSTAFYDVFESESDWATSVLEQLKSTVPPTPKLYPAGRIMWTPSEVTTTPSALNDEGDGAASATPADDRHPAPSPAPEEAWLRVDQTCFDHLVISGSAIFADHMPQSYARALIGDGHVA
jgi:hypothetical protein